MRTSDIAILIKNVTKYYQDFQALDNISFQVKRGDFFAFLGANGAGKTTTINTITGLSNYQSGTVEVFGYNTITEYPQTRRLIGLCAQEFNFDPFLNIHQLLVYQAGYFGIFPSIAKKRAMELLERFQLADKRALKFRALSGGMKKRLLLCRALIHDPEILILDEPTAGCDLELKYLIWDYLAQLNKEGKTIFLTTHNMEEAEKLCKTIGIINHGRIVRIGEKKAVLQDKSLEDVFLEVTGLE
ncbi:MAG: ABC transporter ATP-binding protein [Candidatus Omnitrophota bacterium]|nr:ABC transporter ATP-binding protein [Candidatus Omnitrophota bacterium]MDZ4242637.1 ABC transporter ATP-binding protein [Candidatus Omnitrophota bacterium]